MCDAFVVAYEAKIRRLAEKTARQNAAGVSDLTQVACIAVWQLDPERVHTNEQVAVMRVAFDAMRLWLRQERRARLIARLGGRCRPASRRRPVNGNTSPRFGASRHGIWTPCCSTNGARRE